MQSTELVVLTYCFKLTVMQTNNITLPVFLVELSNSPPHDKFHIVTVKFVEEGHLQHA